MKRPGSKSIKRVARSSAGKHQSSILSFFSPKGDRAAPSASKVDRTPKPVPSRSQKPKPLFSDQTPSTVQSLEPTPPRSTRSRTYADRRFERAKRGEPSLALKRELFLDADDEEPLVASKRARVHGTATDEHSSMDSNPPTSRLSDAKSTAPASRASRGDSLRNGFGFGAAQTSENERSAKDSISRFYSGQNASPTREERQSNLRTAPVLKNVTKFQQEESVQTIAMDVDAVTPEERRNEGGFLDLSSMSRPDRSKSSSFTFDFTPRPMTEERRRAREKLAAHAVSVCAVGEEEGGWCARHPWSVNIRDSKKRAPSHPDYDKSTLYVPPSALTDNRGTKNGGLSPFQRQFWSIKKDNYDVLIFFKKGKFYELYDVDADIGHKVLGLNYTKGGRVDMRCCGVPEQAFDKHTARLVELGYKVGRVEQTETAMAAEKRKNASSGNKSSVCERSLVRILTKATVSDDGLLRDHRSRFVIALTEAGPEPSEYVRGDEESQKSIKGGDQMSTTIGICYVDVASGSINVRQFRDDARLCTTERLVAFLKPHEFIIDSSACGERLLNIVRWATLRNEADLLDLAKKDGFQPMTESLLATYLLDSSSTTQHKDEYNRVCQYIKQNSLGSKALGTMSSYLKSLIIDRETLSIGNYNLFPSPGKGEDSHNEAQLITSPGHLLMDASTLQNLEILTSTMDGSERGTLLSFIDRARTPAGRRLLKRWIAEPLVSSEEIEDRLQAIEDIHVVEDEDGGRSLSLVLKQLKTRKDLERALPRLHRQATTANNAVMFDDTNKRMVKDFVLVLRSLQDSLCALETLGGVLDSSNPKSGRLKWLCATDGGIPADALDKLTYFLGEAFDLKKAETDGEIVPKEGAIPSYDACREALDEVEHNLSLELRNWQTKLGDKAIKFYHRGKEPYQLEIKLATLKGHTPDEFEVVSESKAAKRFYTRRVKGLVRKHKVASEAYDRASSSVARDIMRQFDQEYTTWKIISEICAEVDALIGLACASRDEGSGPMVRPTILSNSHPHPVIDLSELRHPILASVSESFVSNDVLLGPGDDSSDIMILTGPNAGGKSTLARQIAIAVILAQVGCFVPARACTLRPFEDIYVRMGASDDLARGRSTFMVEMEEVSNILNNATSRSLVIADEVGRGTSTHDGYAVAYAALDHIARVNKSLTVFSTHYSQLGDDIVALGDQGGRSSARIFEMAAKVNEKTKSITFLYKLQAGSSGQSRGVYCARVAGIPASVANVAEEASHRFDHSLAQRLSASKFKNINNSLDGDQEVAMKAIKGL
ncbi:DNA mismatch repair protein MutS [Gracilaria domingensis]|nr:DNA mismatch repair protein MutS [Gracilaria domingensis]